MTLWPIRLLGELIEERTERLRDSTTTIYSVTNEDGFVRSLDLFDKRVFSMDVSNYKRVDYNDLAYNPSRINVGSIALCKDEKGGAVSPMYIIIRCRPGLLPNYLLHFLKSKIGLAQIRHRCEGAVRFQLKFKDLCAIPILAPPLSEQERMLHVLDEADVLRKLRVQADRLTAELIPALFHEMFGNPDEYTKRWGLCSLSEVGTLDRGRSKTRPRDDPSLYGGEYPFIQTGDVANSNGIIKTYRQTYSEKGLAQSRIWPEGTLCITIAANIGKTAVLTFPACFPDSLVGFIPGERVIAEYVRQWLVTVEDLLEKTAPQAAQKNINLRILGGLKIPVPPLSLQKEFSERVNEIRKLEADQAASRLHLEALFQSLLHRAFSGEL